MSESAKVDVLGVDGKPAGTAELPAVLFNAPTNIPLIHQVVVAQQAAARQGTHATKTHAEVSGTGRKPYRQKGTGRARQGSLRGPQFTGGYVAHGPQPHGYLQRTPKKMIAAALRGALSDRARDGRIFVVTSLASGEAPSTKQARATLSALGDFRSLLVVLGTQDAVNWLSVRNLPEAHAISWDQLNAYDVLVNEALVFTQDALAAFVAARLGNSGAEPDASGQPSGPAEQTQEDK